MVVVVDQLREPERMGRENQLAGAAQLKAQVAVEFETPAQTTAEDWNYLPRFVYLPVRLLRFFTPIRLLRFVYSDSFIPIRLEVGTAHRCAAGAHHSGK